MFVIKVETLSQTSSAASCISSSDSLLKSLNNFFGITTATVNYASEKAFIKFFPEETNAVLIIKEIKYENEYRIKGEQNE